MLNRQSERILGAGVGFGVEPFFGRSLKRHRGYAFGTCHMDRKACGMVTLNFGDATSVTSWKSKG